jgi:hypothetical protein
MRTCAESLAWFAAGKKTDTPDVRRTVSAIGLRLKPSAEMSQIPTFSKCDPHAKWSVFHVLRIFLTS